MLKWLVELCGYDITFKPRMAMKTQALADFLRETSLTKDVGYTIISYDERIAKQTPKCWIMMVDEALNVKGSGIGIIFKSPSEKYVEMKSIRLNFLVSNKQAEYEALLQ